MNKMTRQFFIATFLLLAIVHSAFSDSELSGLFPLVPLSHGKIELYNNHSLTESNPNIEQAIIVVHGSARNVRTYFDTMRQIVIGQQQADHTIVIAPHFKNEEDTLLPNELQWTDEGWVRGDEDIRTQTISSYQVMDEIITQLSKTSLFPNLKKIILTGHSAGGQLSQRYALATSIEQKLQTNPETQHTSAIQFVFAPANPGSYVYLTSRRPFLISRNCPYNDYKYGLQHLNHYLSDRFVTSPSNENSNPIQTYLNKKIFYLTGELDIETAELDNSCEALAQGRTRHERALAFKQQLDLEFSLNQHQIVNVPKVGHTQYGMYHSPEVMAVLFQP